MGMSVCRTWAFNDGDGPNALQISPGVFNERVFQVRSIDFLFISFFFLPLLFDNDPAFGFPEAKKNFEHSGPWGLTDS